MNAHRVIKRLQWAEPLKERPACIPSSRPRGAKGAGLRYERALARHLSEGAHGVWFEFRDENGSGYCQTDHLYSFLPTFVAVLEVKYTLVLEAYSKLRDFYLPIVSKAMKCPTVGIIIVHNLVPGFEGAFTDLPSAAVAAEERDYPTVLHWRGQPLMPKGPHYTADRRSIAVAQGPSPIEVQHG